MRRALIALPVMLLLAVGCAAPPGTSTDGAAPAGTGSTATTPAWANEMLGLVNARRAEVGAPPLRLCATLTTAAQRHSDDQAAHATMSHTGSDGSNMVQRAEAAGYLGWTALAENVAAGQPSVESVVGAWMGSPGHRANLLSTTSTDLGLGRAASGSGTLYWTQVFGRSGSC